MASTSQRAKVSPAPPHFFKIILEQTLENNKLQIPKTFWMKYCGSLSSSQVILKLPCGSRWEVGLTKSDGNVWIEKGWNKFAEHYSLNRGNLLVFRYDGVSQFTVIIFDKTTTEIDYSSNPSHFEKHVDTDEDDDVSIEVLDSTSWSPKTRDKSPLPCSRPQKKMRQSALGKAQSNLSHLRSKVMQKGSLSSKVGNTIGNITGLSTPKRYQKPSPVYTNTSALERVNYFQSEYPFFTVIMKSSYTTGRRNFHIPSWFAETYVKKKECEASLWVSNGKSWSVQYKVIGRSAEFGYGWKAFALENSLEVGDICNFEQTNNYGNEISFRVSIVKVEDDAYNDLAAKISTNQSKRNVELDSSFVGNDKASMISQNTIEREKFGVADKSRKLISEVNTGNRGTSYKRPSSSVVWRTSEAASNSFSENPCFQVALRSAHVQGYKLSIPLDFARLYFKEKTQTMTLWVGESCWYVKFLVYKSSDYSFSAGWSVFARENSLQPRDVCIFELIKRNHPELKVSIIRQSAAKIATTPSKQNVKLDSSFAGMISQNIIEKKEQEKVVVELSEISESNTGNQDTNKRPSPSAVRTASEAASHFFSIYPRFKVALQSDHVHGGCKLPIPLTSASYYFGEKTQTTILWVGEEYWNVKLIVNESEYKLSTGWAAFARENSLKPRDICIFELIKRDQPEMKVTIFRHDILYF
ncbi:B3 domain-containing protein Os03g0619800-like [Humulus lupulus]|uniref:B3 domain-containing protein Os03g0619800-like n=1 Tax=Humulus lupulus TaxID=3486 RepID=UPI002B410A7B|nr:B3 domain-containing protein Os03g0619800-like [Humulus lupulus]